MFEIFHIKKVQNIKNLELFYWHAIEMTRDSIEKLAKYKLEVAALKPCLTHGFQGAKSCGCGFAKFCHLPFSCFVRQQANILSTIDVVCET